jgi:tetratricopeptide (TPR) repeat protein
MSDGSIDIDDTQGDVSGVIKDSIGSIGAKIVYVGGNLVINNSTTKERATLKKIQDLSTETNAIEKGIITREEFTALQRAIIEIKNLLERNQAYSIKAGNVQVSRTELSLKEIILKGNEYLDSRHLSVALDYYDQAIKIDPNYAYAWNNKGIALRNLGKYDEAIECYDRAIKIDPNYAGPWNSKGWALSNLGKHKDAIECYDRAIKIDPNYADAWNNKGVSLRKIGQQKDADRCFAKARELGF